MEHLPGSHNTILREIDDIRTFIMNKVKEHEQNLDVNDPKDFIDCFLNRLNQVTAMFTMFYISFFLSVFVIVFLLCEYIIIQPF